MNLRDIGEAAPLLVQYWNPNAANIEIGSARIGASYYLLLRSWERQFERLHQPHYFSTDELNILVEEIVCGELLTVTLSGLVLACGCFELDDQIAITMRQQAAEHAVIRDAALEFAGSSADNLSEQLRLHRFRRRMARWIDLVLEPVAESAFSAGVESAAVLPISAQQIHKARTSLTIAGLRKQIPQRRVDDPYRRALWKNLISESLGYCRPEINILWQ